MMINKVDPKKRDALAATGYLLPFALFVFLWGKSHKRRFHGYQGIALLAYAAVALILTDIACGLLGIFPLWPLAGVVVIYTSCTIILTLVTLSGKSIDMKIYKSPVHEEG